MDGNESLRRVLRANIGDKHILEDAEYMVDRAFVNQYTCDAPDVGFSSDNPSMDADPMDEGETDGGASTCTERWKAAAADSNKRMWGFFDETGVFVSACRHHLVLWVVDMVKSGELAKYGLATISKMIESLGDHLLIGYDIGCSFSSTVLKSSLAGAFQSKGYQLCTDVFHGFAHNYACQVKNHPYGIQGAGMEDLGGMERIFSASNILARTTRYASPYMRHLLIEIYFSQWDEDKVLTSGKLIYQNFIQSLRILDTDGNALKQAMEALSLDDEAIEDLRKDEARYLEDLRTHEIYDRQSVAYVQLLLKLQRAEDDYDATHTQMIQVLTQEDFAGRSSQAQYETALSRGRHEETEWRNAEETLGSIRRQVIELEVALGIESNRRWTPADPQYREALKHLVQAEYYDALENLERLVVQRLFELQKLNISQPGYNMRQNIRHNLSRRGRAIESAIARYNTVAAKLTPPKPSVEWRTINEYEFLQDFALLADCRPEILMKKWANNAVRFAMRQQLKVMRAAEEITWCEVEARRWVTYIADQEQFFDDLLEKAEAEETPELVCALVKFCSHHRRLHTAVRKDLNKLFAHPRFEGERSPGVRDGTTALESNAGQSESGAEGSNAVEEQEEPEEGDVNDGEGGDAEFEEVDNVVQFLISCN